MEPGDGIGPTRVAFLLASAAAMLIWTVSCAASMPRESPLVRLAGSWSLSAFDDGPLNEVTAAKGRPSMTVASDGRLTGFAGVNRFHGSIDVAYAHEGHFHAGPLATTRMAGPPESMQLEHRFLGVLAGASSFRVDGARLDLLRGDALLARFDRAPE